MSDFTAKIIAQLDTSKIPSQIAQIGKSGINLSNVKIQNVQMDTSKLASQVQAALNNHKFTVNISNIGVGNIPKSATNGLTKSLTDRINSQISNGGIEASIAKVTAQYEKLGATGHSKLSQIKSDIETLNKLQSQLNTSSNDKALISNYEKFNETLSKVKNNLTTVSAESKTFVNSFQINSLDNKISSWVSKNTKALSLYGNNINSLQSQLKALANSGNVTVSQLKNIEQEFNQIKLAAAQAGATGRTFGDTMKSAFSSISKYVSASTIIYQSIRAIKDMAENVYEVDRAMTELYRVTDLTSSQYKSLYADMTNSAKQYGAALSDIIDSTASWVRLGFDSNTANQLAEITAMYQHVTDLDNSTAVNNLVTAYKGFQDQLLELTNGDEAAAIELVADIYDKLGNEFALSAADVGSGLSKAASTLQLAGNSIQESAAMLTGITEVTQDPDKAGNALKILSLRIRGMKGELEELGEDVDENVESLSKMQTQVLNLTHGKVNIFEDDGSFRSTYEIMQDISSVYDKLSDTERASLLETIAGKNRANDVAALISNWGQVEKAMQAASNAEGTASEEQAKYMDSIQGRLSTLKATWQSFSNTVISSDFVKVLVSSLTKLLSVLDTLMNKFGTIPTLLTAAFATSAIKKVGIFKDIPGMIANLNKLGAAIKALNGLNITQVGVNSGNIQAYQAAIKGLSAEQAAYALATRGANEAQIEEIMTTQTATLAKGTYTQADVQAAIAKQGLATASTILTAEQQAEIVNSGLLTSEKLAEVAATIGLTTAEDGSLVSKEMLNAEMVKQQLTSIGVVGAQQQQVMSILGLTAAETAQVGVTNILTAAWSSLTAAIAANPIGAVLVAAAAAIVGVIAYTKHMANEAEEAAEALREAHQEAENTLNESKNAISSTQSELSSVESQLASIKDEVKAIASKTTLTFVDKQQIDKLTTAEQLLKSQEQTLKNNLEMQARANANNAKQLLDTQYTSHMYINEAPNATWSAYSEQKMVAEEDISQSYDEWYETFKRKYLQQSYNQYLDAIETADKEGIEYWSNIVSANEAQIAAFTNELYGIVANFQNDDGTIVAGYEDLYEKYMGYINDLQSLTNPEIFSELISSWSENSDYDFESEYEKAIENVYDMDKWDFSTFKEENEDFVNQLAEYGISEDTISAIFREKRATYDSLIAEIDTKYNSENVLRPHHLYSSDYVKTPEDIAREEEKTQQYEAQVEKVQKIHDSLANYAKNNPTEFKIIADTVGFDGLNDEIEKQLENVDDVETAVSNAISNVMDELNSIDVDFSFEFDMEAETEGMEKLFTAMKESVTSTGLTAESITNLKERYQDLENYDASKLFERTTNGIHLNTKALRELESEYENHKKAKFDEQLSTLVDKYNELTEEISNADDAASTGDLYRQRSDILDQINDVADLAAQYDGLTSAFYKWEQAQSIGEEGDMYDNLAGSLEDIKKLYEDGLIGTNKFRTAVQLMSNEDLSTASIDELLAAYESGYPVMQRYFTDSSDGCLNFLNDIQNLNSEWAKMNEDGSWEINFGLGNDQEIADALGINVESVQSLMRKLSDYGFDINLDSVYSSFDLLSSKAEEANEKLKELSKTEYTFNFETQDIDYINEQITEAQNILNTFKDTNGNIDVSIEGAEEAQTILISLISNKQALSAPEIMQIDTSAISDADTEISNAIGLLQQFIQYSNDLEIQTALGIDTSETQEKLQTVASDLDAIPDEIKTKLGIDDESFQTAITNLSEKEIDVKAGVNLSEEDIASVQASIDGITAKDIELLTNSSEINEELKGINEYTISDKTFKVTISNNALTQLQNINSYVIKDKSYTITAKTVNSGSGKSQGSAYAKGVAYNSGTWGTKDSGTALGGEIGEEIVVRDGKYFTIGSDGAEFFNYKKGDIIFNAEQSRQIFANGKITNGKKRGVTYASGNAFIEGTAFSSGSGKITASGKVKTSASNNSSKSNKSDKSDKKKDDKSIIDWIEVKIDRIERKIKKLSTIAESSFKTFSKRNKALADEISQVTKEIDVQQQAYDRYMKEAKSVGLSKDLVKKVKNGTIDINEYDSDTADKIQEYQKWYEAALDCQQAIQDLGETISELYKQKFDNLVTEWTNKVQDLQHIAERTDAQTSRRSDYASEYVTYDKSKWANTSNISDYQSLVKNAQNQIAVKTGEIAALKSELDADVANGSIEWGSEAYYEMLASIQDVENEVDDLNSDIIDYSNKISDAYKNMFEDIASEYSDKLSLAEHLSNEYNTAIEKAEAMGYASSSKYYELLRNEEQNQIATLKSEQKDLSDALYSAVASGEIEVGSAAWYEMSQEICNVTEQIQEAELAVIELNNQIRQVQWDNFDYLEDTISKLKDESDFLIDLLSSSNLYEDNGQLTDAGVSTMGLHGVNYNVLMSQADDYAAEILSLNKQIASDPANTTLIDRRNELLSIQRQCIQAAEDEKAAIKDLVSDGISKELSSLKELIGKYTDALDSQKDLYSFQKKVEKQTKNIATLQKQLSAYQNDVTEETKAKIQKIKVDLEEAKDDLEETQYEQYISDQKKLLDELYDEYERILNERLDNIDALIEDMIAMVNGSAITINDTLNAAASSVGYTMTTEMSNLWSNAANELAQSRAEQLANVTALINQMVANGAISQENANSILAALGSGSAQEIQNALNIISKLQENGELDTTNANSLISALNTQGTNYTGVITTYGTDFSNKQTVTNNTLDGIKNTVNSILTAANTQAELVKQQVDAEKAAAASAAAAAQSAAQAAANSTKTAAAAAATSSTPTTTSSNTGQEKKTSSTSTPKKDTTTTTKKTTTQGDGQIQVGDKVTFKSGKYYCDSYGGKPTGSKNVGKTVYVTKINTKGSKPYHISTGSKLGSGDLGWLTKSQISGYMSGAKEINRDELAWTNENYDKIGGETIVRKSDHAVLSTLSKGSRVYNALASDNIWKMANNPGSFIMDNLLGNGSIDTSSISSGGNNDIEQNIDLDINIDNVEDLDDLLNQMKKSKDFEKLIQAIAVAPLTGTSVNKKNRFNF